MKFPNNPITKNLKQKYLNKNLNTINISQKQNNNNINLNYINI